MSELSLAVLLEGVLIGLGGKSKRVPEAHRSEGTREVVGGEGIEGGGLLLSGSRGKGGGGTSKEGEASELHFGSSIC